MFAITKCTRPNRCEVCKWVVNETRYLPPPPGTVINYEPGRIPYGPIAEPVSVLVCKRMPPHPNERGNGVSPIVWSGDFCGEFEAKEE